jgi:TetR/AcrR family transcriptional regulator, lmrAB and yxaGH operons repressor
MAQVLRSAGLPADDADAFATLLIAASEGAVVMARAQRELAPFEAVCAQLRALAASFPAR